jgi:halocyanin-like protein
MADTELQRRRFLVLSGIAGTTLLAGCSGGGGGDGGGGDSSDGDTGGDSNDGGGGGDGGGGDVPSEVDEYLSGAQNYDGSVSDATGEDNPTVDVGAGSGLAYGPAAIRVSTGTTVTWEWTGQGGGHNVIAEDETFESGEPVSEEGTTFEHTFEETGNFLYYCDPHKVSGMKGAVIVE